MLPTAWAIAVAAALLLLLLLLLRARSRRGDLPPGPRGLPLLGYLPWLDPKNPHLTLTNLARKYGGIYGLRLGGIYAVVLSDTQLIREALARNAFNGRAPLYLTHGIMGGNGIICAEGEKWKDQRKFVTSHLRSFGMSKSGRKRCKMESDIKRGVEDFAARLERAPGAVDTEPPLMHSLGNVVFELVFGKTWQENDESWRKLLTLQEEGTKLIGIAGVVNFLPFLRFLPKYKNVLRYLRSGIAFSHRIYEDILRGYRSQGAAAGEDPEHFVAAFDREMSLRGDTPGFFTLSQYNFLMADLWGAGVDTTIATLRWFFLFMATHPAIQEKAHTELDEVLGGGSLTLDDLPALPYLRACISETQRIRSVTPLGIPHGTLEALIRYAALQETHLAGCKIPKGSMIVPLQWAVHMNPALHRDPDTYDPSRFFGEDGKYRKLDAFIPFQTGKRMCLGEEYAKMLLFLFGGGILHRFTLSAEGDATLEGDVGITLTPKPHRIRFAKRRTGARGGGGGGGGVLRPVAEEICAK